MDFFVGEWFGGWLDMGLVLLAFGLLMAALWGLGRMMAYVLRFALPRGLDGFGYIWLGLAAAVFFLAVVHFRLPITPAVGGALYGSGLVVALVAWWRGRGQGKRDGGRGSLPRTVVQALILGSVALWLASRALLPPVSSDSGLYYITTIRWANEYPIVPGLSNLHGRFGFNQSLFLWIASLNLGPWTGHGFALANPFLCWLVFTEGVLRVGQRWGRATPFSRHSTIGWTIQLLLLPPVVYIMVMRPLSSAQPDLTSELLQLVLFAWYARFLASDKRPDQWIGPVWVMLSLSALAVTVKLSNVFFVGALGALLVLRIVLGQIVLGQKWGQQWGQLVRGLAWAALLVGVWYGRGFILSGCPIYPTTVLCVDFPWSVPLEQAQVEAAWIYSWARQPWVHYEEVLSSWAWLGPWFMRTIAEERVNVVLPVVWAGVGGVVGAWAWSRQASTVRRDLLGWWGYLLTPLAVGLIAWFLAAPSPRFAQGFFWLLPVVVWTPLLGTPGQRQAWRIGGLFALLNGPLLFVLVLYGTPWPSEPGKGFGPVPTVALVEKTTDSGLVVYVPAEGYHCWDSPLPCTPYFNPGLHLLGEGLGSGFALGPGETAAPSLD